MSGAALIAALIAALANVLGAVAVTWRRSWSVQALEQILALAAGFMISVAITEMFPEAVARHGSGAAVVVLIGFLAVHLTQHTLTTHFHFGEETHRVSHTVGISALAGMMLHTAVDGVAIASGFEVSVALGTLIFLAILLHKLPEGLAISSLFLAAGAGRGRALAAAVALGISTLVGALLAGGIGALREWGLALSAGVTLYVAASNLVPEFQGKPGWRLPLSFFAGCLLFFAARLAVLG